MRELKIVKNILQEILLSFGKRFSVERLGLFLQRKDKTISG